MIRAGIVTLGLALLVSGAHGQDAAEKADEQILKEAGLPTEPAGLLKYLKGLPPTAEQRRQAAALVGQLGDPAYLQREDAEEQLAKLLPGSIVALRPATRSDDPEIAARAKVLLDRIERDGTLVRWRAAVHVVLTQPPPGTFEVLLDALPLCFDEVAEEVLDGLVRLAGKADKLPEVVLTAVDEIDPAKRAAAALLLGRSGTAEQRRKVQQLLADPSLEVRFHAALGLLAARDRSGLGVLVQVVREGTPTQARLANDILTALAGTGSVGAIDLGGPAARSNLARAWDAWVQSTGRQLDLSRADVEYGSLNRSLTALQMARKFVALAESANQNGNVLQVKPLIGLPFVHMDSNFAATPQELENVLQNYGVPTPPRGGEITLTTRLQPADTLARAGHPGAKNVVGRHPRDEVVAVDSTYRFVGNSNATRMMIFVRLGKPGTPAKVVGFSFLSLDIRRPVVW
jgi:hypothetical protein